MLDLLNANPKPTSMNITHAIFLTCAMAAASLSSMGQVAKTQATQPDNAPETKADILLLENGGTWGST